MTAPLRVIIAGGGVAGLEAAFALGELAGERVTTTVLAPDEDFVYRPLRVREPFGYAEARHYPVSGICRDAGAELHPDRLHRVDPAARTVHTESGAALEYDALLIALGAQLRPAFAHAISIDDRRIDEQLHGLIQDVEGGYVRSIAFVAPPAPAWPVPLYELALLTARRAYDVDIELAITLATPEEEPLAVFGSEVSRAVAELLEKSRVTLVSGVDVSVPEAGLVAFHPSGETVAADRVVALPELYGPSLPGLGERSRGGFIEIDAHCRVPGLDNVFAAGDAANFPIKHGGIAAQQADTAAEAIAALAGAPVKPEPFHPEIRAILLGADRPLYLSATVTGSHGSHSRISAEPLWSPPAKIAARYLSPYLESVDGH